jgi:DNA-binding transcriptional MerR regulator
MSTFSIKDLEQLSGIKAHTIRIWEQRYKLLSPRRTETNIRFYDDDDLKLVLNVASLKNNGFKISRIVQMTAEQIQQEVQQVTSSNFQFDEQINALTVAMIDFDKERFEKILSTNILKMGFEKTMVGIIFPFLGRIGILWQTGAIRPGQEHFISNLIRQKLIVAIDNQFSSKRQGASNYLLFLPEGELHELSLLFADFIIRSRGNDAIYLGQSLPFDDLVETYKHNRPNYIFTVITSVPGSSDVEAYLHKLAGAFPDCTLLVSGMQVLNPEISVPENITVIESLEQMVQFVEDHSLVAA